MRARAGDLDPVEPIHFRKPHISVHPRHFGGDHLMHLCEGIAIVLHEIWGGFEIVRAFPAINHSEMRASLIQDRGQGGCFCRASGRAVLMRQMESKFVLIVLDGVERRQLLRGMAGETPRI